jgi:hypothetical protein
MANKVAHGHRTPSKMGSQWQQSNGGSGYELAIPFKMRAPVFPKKGWLGLRPPPSEMGVTVVSSS